MGEQQKRWGNNDIAYPVPQNSLFGGGGRITVKYCVRSQCPIWPLFSCKKKLEDGISEFAVAVLEG